MVEVRLVAQPFRAKAKPATADEVHLDLCSRYRTIPTDMICLPHHLVGLCAQVELLDQ